MPVPDLNIYQENGHLGRSDYLHSLAEEYGVPLDTVQALAHLLGPDEDFDGLITALQDYADSAEILGETK